MFACGIVQVSESTVMANPDPTQLEGQLDLLIESVLQSYFAVQGTVSESRVDAETLARAFSRLVESVVQLCYVGSPEDWGHETTPRTVMDHVARIFELAGSEPPSDERLLNMVLGSIVPDPNKPVREAIRRKLDPRDSRNTDPGEIPF